MAQLPAAARSLLDAIAGGESAGRYDVIYGGSRFGSYADHPRQFIPIKSGPNAGKKSSAAGKYQFLSSTWDDQAKKLGLKDFSPESQDLAAWNLAQEEYKRKTGRNLLADLEAGETTRVATALKDQWTSLPGGIEQGRTASQFAQAYGKPSKPTGALPTGGNALSAGIATTDYSAAPSASLTPAQPTGAVPLFGPPPITFNALTLPTRRRRA